MEVWGITFMSCKPDQWASSRALEAAMHTFFRSKIHAPEMKLSDWASRLAHGMQCLVWVEGTSVMHLLSSRADLTTISRGFRWK
jgi:hypothetical protein